MTKHRAEVPVKRPPSRLQKQLSLDNMEKLHKQLSLDNIEKLDMETSLKIINGKNSFSTEDNTLIAKTSEPTQFYENRDERRQLLDSLDLQSRGSRTIEHTRKKVGEYFKKSNLKNASTQGKLARESVNTIVSSENLSNAIAKDSLLLIKPKALPESFSPKLKTKVSKSHLKKGQEPSKSDLVRSKPVQTCNIYERERKIPQKHSDVAAGVSPRGQMPTELSSRPLRLTAAQVNSERLSSYENTSLSVMEIGSDSEDEIMV